MFTGLIEGVGRVRRIEAGNAARRLEIETALAPDLRPGDSLAVNGVCLTVTAADAAVAWADVGPETARITTLGHCRAGQAVNLERSMRADGRFGGHFVQGHVDGLGRVVAIQPEGEAHWLRVGFPPSLARLFIRKGSVAVDGISLTVAELRADEFDVMIVPFTWAATTLPSLAAGDPVNLECDMIGKYVARLVAAGSETRPG